MRKVLFFWNKMKRNLYFVRMIGEKMRLLLFVWFQEILNSSQNRRENLRCFMRRCYFLRFVHFGSRKLGEF